MHTVLAASPLPWLLVFDNAPDRASVARFMPPAGPGRVLVTSRNQIWPPGQAVEVPVLDPQVAAEFLVSRTGDADRRAALELAGVLGGLPLALEQSAAYVQAGGGSLAGYLALYWQRRADLLGRGEPTGYTDTVATTWRLAFEDLQQTAPGAAWLLRLLAFCAPEAIPLRLLLQPRPSLAGRLGEEVASVLTPLLEDPLAASDAIAALRRYSLISPAADGSVSVHRLVQAVTADQMSAEQARELRNAAAALIEDAIPADTEPPATWPTCAALLPHAQAALADNTDGMARMASYLGRSGSYAAARNLQRTVVEARERVPGLEHPRTLDARSNLARWTGEAGDPAAARDLFAALLPVDERVLGPEHPDTLDARCNLARWTGEAGDRASARDLFAALLPVDERVFGPEHPYTLTVRGNLARWTGEAGDPAAARDLFAALLPVSERVSGAGAPAHPDRPRPPRLSDRGGGGPGRGPGPVRRAAARTRAGPRPGAPRYPDRPQQPRPLDRGGRGPGCGPGPVRRAAARGRAGPRPAAPVHPDCPCQPRPLDRGSGRPGCGPGPVRRTAARGRAGPRPAAPVHPDCPPPAHLLDQEGRAWPDCGVK